MSEHKDNECICVFFFYMLLNVRFACFSKRACCLPPPFSFVAVTRSRTAAGTEGLILAGHLDMQYLVHQYQ